MDMIIVHPWLDMKGGAEKIILEIAKHYNAKIYTIKYDKKKTFSKFKEFEIKVMERPNYSSLFKIFGSRIYDGASYSFLYWDYKIKEDYDIINTHGTPSEFIRRKNERVLWYCHSPNREAFDLYAYRQGKRGVFGRIAMRGAIELFKKIEYSVVPKIEKIVTNSQNTNSRIKKYLNRDGASLVYSFVDEKNYSEGPYEKYFFYPSRIVPEKRQDLIIREFIKFSKKFKNFKLIISGYLADRNSAYFRKLKELSNGYPVEFIISPSNEKMKELYSNCYCVLFGAMNEDLGLIPFEAGMSKKPIISINEGGPKETIIDEVSGFLVGEMGFSEKMEFLAENPNEVEKMGKEGYKNIKGNFSKKRFFERYDKAIREVLGK